MVVPQETPQALPAERVLEIAAPMLDAVGGSWRLVDGPMLRSGSLGIRVLPSDSDDYRHLDLEVLLNADRPDVPTIVDCSTGLAADPVEAARQAIQAWIETCLVTVLEMVEQQGRLANHFRSGDEGGFRGWHAIIGSATGWSVDGSHEKQQWFAERMPWSALADVITPGLDRPHLNGIRLLVGQGGDFTECEVRINGRRHEPSATALAALDWPRSERFGLARTFVLLVGPDA
ncbi:hypothetical protein Acy02nite_80080 [Actinoplanes cyaneus]|uniref:Uncharacterized protein n=1 Tax=Actinoplanes cyaneus TaxID=52696 RepID=A0A919ITE1_9ACTN|nr:DUF6348 family protein [Actinoplanes cyaneus]MCW2140781.1 hypothetical protein [Actinoplanes cyaneus]GID70127.1 hypothetical protein Acy02nite_80080 [Actinoplanes cyaneus]